MTITQEANFVIEAIESHTIIDQNFYIVKFIITGMYLSGTAFALHVKAPGFDPPHLHTGAFLECPCVRLVRVPFVSVE